jgi:hypothetical protein
MRVGRGHDAPGGGRGGPARFSFLAEVAWHSFFRFAKYSLPEGRFKHYSSLSQRVKIEPLNPVFGYLWPYSSKGREARAVWKRFQ